MAPAYELRDRTGELRGLSAVELRQRESDAIESLLRLYPTRDLRETTLKILHPDSEIQFATMPTRAEADLVSLIYSVRLLVLRDESLARAMSRLPPLPVFRDIADHRALRQRLTDEHLRTVTR